MIAVSLFRYGARALTLCVGAVLLSSSSWSIPAGGYTNDPWGDVTGDGVVTQADVDMVAEYLLPTHGTLTKQEKERVRRYGDIAGVVNRTTVGNNVVDTNDALRHVLLSGGVIDAGTAGTYQPGIPGSKYGDVNGDGRVDIVDSVLVRRHLSGKVTDPAILARINARGLGDISPTIPYVSFGDGTIDAADLTTVTARALGTESNPPAYVDYWPMHAPDFEHPTVSPDVYMFTDLNGLTGDMNRQIGYGTNPAREYNGYTVTDVVGDDGSKVGVFKGIDGSVYALYITYPLAFGNRGVVFQSPVKIIDSNATVPGGSFHGEVVGYNEDLGYRRVPFTVTVLANDDVTTAAAGAYLGYSTWSKTLQIRLDIALVAYRAGQMEMQQAFFFDFAPFIGIVTRGQTAMRGSPAPTPDKPYCELDTATVRGIMYAPGKP